MLHTQHIASTEAILHVLTYALVLNVLHTLLTTSTRAPLASNADTEEEEPKYTAT